MPETSLSRPDNGGDRLSACPICKIQFRKIRHQTYCSQKCRSTAWLNRKVEIAIAERLAKSA